MTDYLERLRNKELSITKIVVITEKEEEEIYQNTKKVIDKAILESVPSEISNDKAKLK